MSIVPEKVEFTGAAIVLHCDQIAAQQDPRPVFADGRWGFAGGMAKRERGQKEGRKSRGSHGPGIEQITLQCVKENRYTSGRKGSGCNRPMFKRIGGEVIDLP